MKTQDHHLYYALLVKIKKKAALEWKKIFPAKNSKGFTLIELLIVLFLVGSLSALILPRLSTVDRVKTSIRKINVVIKQVQNQARLSNTLHRLVFEISPQSEDRAVQDKFKQSYYIERATQKDAQVTFTDSEDSKKNSEEEIIKPFEMDTKILKRSEGLPSDFYFQDVEFKDRVVENGKAYVYFFPQGYVTLAAIHITNRQKLNWTIVVQPLTGQTTILNENKRLKDLQR